MLLGGGSNVMCCWVVVCSIVVSGVYRLVSSVVWIMVGIVGLVVLLSYLVFVIGLIYSVLVVGLMMKWYVCVLVVGLVLMC